MHGMTTALPSGSWTHSFEEDADGIEVYRPTATFAFPPSRKGRKVLEFGAGTGSMEGGEATLTSMAPGPDDRPLAGPSTRLRPLGMGRYNKPTQEGLFRHYEAVAKVIGFVLRLARR